MKLINKNINIFTLALLILSGSGCKKDFLSVEPPNSIPAEQVWKDPALVSAFVTEIYNGLSLGGFSEEMLSSASDESLFTHPTRGIDLINSGSINPTTPGWINASTDYNQMYNRIRSCNLTIEHLTAADNVITDPNTKDMLLGQAYFLRAYFYQQLLRYYGGIPLITKTYVLNEDYTVNRGTYEECVNFILKDCDESVKLLTGKAMQKGQATSLAGLALKSRVLLYAASDLHDMAKAKAKLKTMENYPVEHLPFLVYTNGSQTPRWQAAWEAAKAVMDAGTGYKLNLTEKVPDSVGKMNYKSIAMGGGSKAQGIDAAAASELIFARYFIDRSDLRYGRANGPNGYHNWAGNTPIGLLVDDYEMANGTKFSWTNPIHKANPYQNRDPRFYATILYDGAGWKPRDKVSGTVDPANQIQTGEYDLIDEKGTKIRFKGLDTRGSSIENWNGSWTGYYTHKFIDPDPNIVDATQPQFMPWPFFRYTEAVLNYIEASIELGQFSEAVLWLNRIRFRAGMPAITGSSKEVLTEIYRHERRIEMAYEEQRYHDARRWMIAPETLGRKTTYIKVSGTFKPGKSLAKTYRYDPAIYDYTYTPTTETAQENRKWDDKIYFRPFSRDEINRNNKLVQNPGY